MVPYLFVVSASLRALHRRWKDPAELTLSFEAAGLTMKALGWAHEGEEPGKWDRSCLGFDEAWEEVSRLPHYEPKQQYRTRSGTETEETYLGSLPKPEARPGWYQSSTPERVMSPTPGQTASGTSSAASSPPTETRVSFSGQDIEAQQDDDDTVGSYKPEGVDYEELRRRRMEEENERELMA